ncbi:MAG: hypothetical protein IPP66_16850 [Anaerolineales bacterium]|nr:hypothetical protein [Anaerolineales bacterium]
MIPDNKYGPLEKYLRSLPISQEEVTMGFEFIEQVLNSELPPSAYEDRSWWGNQRQGTYVEAIAWMDAGWMVDTVDLIGKQVHFVRQ